MYGVSMPDHRPRANGFRCADDILDEIEASLSRERPGTCLDAVQGNRERAVRVPPAVIRDPGQADARALLLARKRT